MMSIIFIWLIPSFIPECQDDNDIFIWALDVFRLHSKSSEVVRIFCELLCTLTS